MTPLVDLQALIWYVTGDRRLSKAARDAFTSPPSAVQLLFSVVSAWEFAIKVSTGKLTIDVSAAAYIERLRVEFRLKIVEVRLEHAVRVAQLPNHHRDPFDRMLIAQAMVEKVPIITSDKAIWRYDVEAIW